jgi:hypothetical protein
MRRRALVADTENTSTDTDETVAETAPGTETEETTDAVDPVGSEVPED